MATEPPKIECIGVTKKFGGTVALDRVDIAIGRGHVHAIVGENGAGKSTLGKVISGVHRPDNGQLKVDGEVIDIRSPLIALQHSITMVAQELSLLEGRSVVDNVFLGIEAGRGPLLNPRADLERFAALIEAHGFDLDPNARVGSLSVAQQQKVEILRALAREAQVIIMDEPTARLSSAEAEGLVTTIRRLAAKGVTIIFVSHFLDEVLAVADDITIMRNGQVVRTGPAAEETKASLIEAMVGRSLDSAYPEPVRAPANAPTLLSVNGLTRPGAFEDISFDIKAGEIVAMAGLVGAGRTEVARAIFGADRYSSGTMTFDGTSFRPRSPRAAIDVGIGMIPESRRDQALFMSRQVLENVSIAHLDQLSSAGVVHKGAERQQAEAAANQVNVTGATVDSLMGELSGGNQQKSIFARWLMSTPRLLIADEPTRGVDVGAKRGIYDLLVKLAEEGIGVLMISSEIEEVLGIAHRVLVMRSGRLVGELDAQTADSSDVMNLAFGMESV